MPPNTVLKLVHIVRVSRTICATFVMRRIAAHMVIAGDPTVNALLIEAKHHQIVHYNGIGYSQLRPLHQINLQQQ